MHLPGFAPLLDTSAPLAACCCAFHKSPSLVSLIASAWVCTTLVRALSYLLMAMVPADLLLMGVTALYIPVALPLIHGRLVEPASLLLSLYS